MLFTIKNWLKKRKYWILTLITSPVLFAVLSDYYISGFSEDKIFSDIDKIEKRKVGVVLGTSKLTSSGYKNLYFEYRIQATVTLYKAGKIEYVLVSGDNSRKDYDEPSDFKEELVNRGIPAEKIYLDYAGFRTLDSMVRAKLVFGQSKITVISQKFHNERAVYLACKYGMDAIAYNAKEVNVKYGFYTKTREYLARSKAVLDVLFRVQPKFLGEPVLIE